MSYNYLDILKAHIEEQNAHVNSHKFLNDRHSIEEVLKQLVEDMEGKRIPDGFSLSHLDIIDSQLFVLFEMPGNINYKSFNIPLSIFEKKYVNLFAKFLRVEEEIRLIEENIVTYKGMLAFFLNDLEQKKLSRERMLEKLNPEPKTDSDDESSGC